MQEMVIYGVSFDLGSKQPIVLLKTADGNRFLPIWIGHPEAAAILMKLQGASTPRPMTHDLVTDMLDQLDAQVVRITVTELKESTFYASITVQQNGSEVEIDSRPSDAIALAVRAEAPIFAADDVIEESAIEFEGEEVNEDEIVDEFKKFLDDVSPDQFAVGDDSTLPRADQSTLTSVPAGRLSSRYGYVTCGLDLVSDFGGSLSNPDGDLPVSFCHAEHLDLVAGARTRTGGNEEQLTLREVDVRRRAQQVSLQIAREVLPVPEQPALCAGDRKRADFGGQVAPGDGLALSLRQQPRGEQQAGQSQHGRDGEDRPASGRCRRSRRSLLEAKTLGAIHIGTRTHPCDAG